MANRRLRFGDQVRIEAPHLSYHGWHGVLTRAPDRHHAGLIAVRFKRPDHGPNATDVGFFHREELHLDAITELGRLADEP